jgi:hypothetical protein
MIDLTGVGINVALIQTTDSFVTPGNNCNKIDETLRINLLIFPLQYSKTSNVHKQTVQLILWGVGAKKD